VTTLDSLPQTQQSSHDRFTTTRTFIGGFESTYMPVHGVDVTETTHHDRRWRDDVDELVGVGIRKVRYPLRWHRIEAEEGSFDWTASDAQLGYLRDAGVEPILDLMHHTSYPSWLTDGFRDRRFPLAFSRYAEAVAERYSWVPAYTLFNEPFATLFLAGHEALWPPYDRGLDGFVRLAINVMPAVVRSAAMFAELLPSAAHIWIDTCEHHSGRDAGAEYARLANDRRHVLLDLALHEHLDEDRPFLGPFLRAGGDAIAELPAIDVDVLGLDYYAHSEWWYDDDSAYAPSPDPIGFARIAEQYWLRYGLPMMLSETNVRGLATDKASWLRHTLEQYDLAVSRGIPLDGYCWFPYVDSRDWDSLLARPAGRTDPVGVVSLGADGSRRRTIFTDVWESAARGTPVRELPAYRLQPPCDGQLAGLLPYMADWPWQEPPAAEWCLPTMVRSRSNAVASPYLEQVRREGGEQVA
jgi:beta-glucosidase/6-phospho-beta-glucosidase/beta-galactosidase